jgi:hypothetical protein
MDDSVSRIVSYIVSEWEAIMHAPILFLTAACVVGVVVWLISKNHYKQEIAALRAQMDHFRTLVEHPLRRPYWDLDQTRFDRLVAVLSQHKQPREPEQRAVEIYRAVGCPENESFIVQLRTAMEAADWVSLYQGTTDESRYQDGIYAGGKDPRLTPQTREVLGKALSRAGIPCEVSEGEDFGRASGPFLVIGKRQEAQ